MEFAQIRAQWHRDVAKALAEIDPQWKLWDGPSPGMAADGASYPSPPMYGECSEILVGHDEEYWGDIKHWIVGLSVGIIDDNTPEEHLNMVARREFPAEFTPQDVAEWAHQWVKDNIKA